MGIREQGYRHWNGTYTGHAWRWWTVCKQGLRTTIYNKMRLFGLLLLIVISWIYHFFLGVSLYLGDIGGGFDRTVDADQILRGGFGGFGGLFWGVKFHLVIVPLFVAVVASPVVANDLRTNALYIYLAKPMRRIDYIVGKFAAVFLWALPVTVFPMLFAWFMAQSASSAQLQIKHPGEILAEALVAELAVVLVLTTIAVAVSSLTKRWTLAFLAFTGVYYITWFLSDFLQGVTRDREWAYLSIRHNLDKINQKVLEQKIVGADWEPSLALVLLLPLLGFGVYLWRIYSLEVAE